MPNPNDPFQTTLRLTDIIGRVLQTKGKAGLVPPERVQRYVVCLIEGERGASTRRTTLRQRTCAGHAVSHRTGSVTYSRTVLRKRAAGAPSTTR